MTFDEYQTVTNSPVTFRLLRSNLTVLGSVFIAWTDERGSLFEVLFTHCRTQIYGQGATGVKGGASTLFVSVMRKGAFGFRMDGVDDIHPNYIAEKLGMGQDNETAEKFAELVNGVRHAAATPATSPQESI